MSFFSTDIAISKREPCLDLTSSILFAILQNMSFASTEVANYLWWVFSFKFFAILDNVSELFAVNATLFAFVKMEFTGFFNLLSYSLSFILFNFQLLLNRINKIQRRWFQSFVQFWELLVDITPFVLHLWSS